MQAQTQVNSFWWRWLMVVAVGVIIFSLSLIVLPDTMFKLFNTLFFGSSTADDRFNAASVDYITFVYGVLGAVMIGWMVNIMSLLSGPFRRGEQRAWWSITLSIMIWYIIDSSFSIYAGFIENAIFNTVFLIAFAIPLIATYNDFNKTDTL